MLCIQLAAGMYVSIILCIVKERCSYYQDGIINARTSSCILLRVLPCMVSYQGYPFKNMYGRILWNLWLLLVRPPRLQTRCDTIQDAFLISYHWKIEPVCGNTQKGTKLNTKYIIINASAKYIQYRQMYDKIMTEKVKHDTKLWNKEGCDAEVATRNTLYRVLCSQLFTVEEQ